MRTNLDAFRELNREQMTVFLSRVESMDCLTCLPRKAGYCEEGHEKTCAEAFYSWLGAEDDGLANKYSDITEPREVEE